MLRRMFLMASRHEVSWIDRNDRLNPHERIVAIGGSNPDRSVWKLSQKEAIEAIKSNKYVFFVKRDGRELNLVVAQSHIGYDFIKTETDSAIPVSLLGLPAPP